MAPQISLEAPRPISSKTYARRQLRSAKGHLVQPWKGSFSGANLRKLQKRRNNCALSPSRKTRTSRLLQQQQQRLSLASNNSKISQQKNNKIRRNNKLVRSIKAASNSPLNPTSIPTSDLLRSISVSSPGPILTPLEFTNFASMNCYRQLVHNYKRNELVLWMIDQKIDIIAVQDHGVSLNVYSDVNSPHDFNHLHLGWGYHLYFTKKTGFITSPLIKILNFEAVSDLIFKIEVKSLTDNNISGNLNSCTLISAYAPHAGYDMTDKTHFYEQLLQTCQKSKLVVLLGDMNAVIDKNRCGAKIHTGNIADGKTRENSDLLMELLDFASLSSLGTLNINAPDMATYFGTQSLPNPRMIDHICMTLDFINSSCNIFTVTSPIGSDHKAVVASIKIKLAIPKPQQKKKADLSALRHGIQRDENIVDQTRDTALQNTNSYDSWLPHIHKALDALPRQCRISFDTLPPAEVEEILGKAKSNSHKDKLDTLLQYVRIAKYVNSNMANSPALAWKAIRSTDPKPPPLPELSTDEYKTHFEDLFLKLKPEDYDTVPNLDTPKLDLGETPPAFLLGPISLQECRSALPHLSNDKATGLDSIPYEFLKIPGVIDHLLPFINEAYSGRPVPHWLVSEIVPIFKNKGDRMNIANYRPISLISCCAKFFNLIILIRLRNALDNSLRTNQNAFRPNRGISEHTLSLQRTIQLAKAEGRTVILTFVDFCNAFNSVYWHKLQEALIELHVPAELITAIMATMKGATSVVRTPDGPTDPFSSFAGVLQGDPLSPFLFICVIDVIMRRAMKDVKGFPFLIKKRKINPDGSTSFESCPDNLTDLNYADDLVLLSLYDDAAGCQSAILALDKIAATYGLKINYAVGKTEILIAGAPPASPFPPILSSNGTPINVVNDYKYLGSYLMDTSSEVNRRIGLAWMAAKKNKNLFHSNLNIKKKAQIFYSIVISLLLASSETWTLTTALVTRLSGAYTKLVRFILQKKVWCWESRISNEDLFGDHFLPFKELLVKRTLNFAGHCARSSQPISSLILAEPQRHVNRGRPQLTYPAMLSRITGLPLTTLREKIMRPDTWDQVIIDSIDLCKAKREKEKANAKADLTTIIPFHLRAGRKRSAVITANSKVQRKRIAKKQLYRLVCRKCKIPHCQTHCQLCSYDQNDANHHSMMDIHWICCDLCFRLCGRNCLCPPDFIGLSALNTCFNTDDWENIESQDKFFCKDCQILSVDLTDKFKPRKPKFPHQLNPNAPVFVPAAERPRPEIQPELQPPPPPPLIENIIQPPPQLAIPLQVPADPPLRRSSRVTVSRYSSNPDAEALRIHNLQYRND